MIAWLTYVVVGLSVLLCLAAVWYAVRDRLIDDRLLVVAGLLELALVVLLVTGLVGLGHITDSAERATFVAYLVSLPVIPPGTAFLAIKEKSRWAMGSIAVGAFAVGVMSARLLQIWMSYA
ncbi:hypothetical protein [Phycicoccus sonneratiae]|uniref:Integral membrane protein n=1 Tax=Phycicoccus sonneratiae TaxID=2807628 RepID=A0ABS2CLA1_9MICO|nr:hypothetical protein [Phycicoccus sonneraticus]MBM6400243.1 hypothetical protein [Phycicoccus sonneraticus]